MTERPTRPLGPGRRQRDGSYVFESCFSPESFRVGAQCYVPPGKVIPVVFVPGIMGSNVKVKPNCEDKVRKVMGLGPKTRLPKSWRPPNIGELGRTAEDFKGRRPKDRQALLNPEWTEVDPGGRVAVPGGNFIVSPDGQVEGAREARARGWGTVHWFLYGPMLLAMEKALNLPSPLALSGQERLWNGLLDRLGGRAYGDFRIQAEELKKLDTYQFPVYAVGYNWTRSNRDSAQYLKEKIDWIIGRYSQELGYTCKQVIVVTHSMGGLVARVCAKHFGMEGKILGIVHGVMPAVGAPEAYRRCVAGLGALNPSFDPSAHAGMPGDGSLEAGRATQQFVVDLSNLMKLLMGPSAKDTTPVMANSPGCLELLPSHLYPGPWLQVQQSGAAQPALALPQSDPYTEIYKREDVWYRLVDPKLLDPAEIHGKNDWGAPKGRGGSSQAWMAYTQRVDEVARFHRQVLGSAYHTNTYAFHSEGLFTYGAIRWRFHASSPMAGSSLAEAPPGASNLYGHQEFFHQGQKHGAWIEWPEAEMGRDPQRWSGDGTVPLPSGEAPGHAGVSRIYRLKGFGHAEVYMEDLCQAVTLWSILQMLPEKA